MTIPQPLLLNPELSDHQVAKVAGVGRYDITLARHTLLFELAAEVESLRIRAENAEEFSRLDQAAVEAAEAELSAAVHAVREATRERDAALTDATIVARERDAARAEAIAALGRSEAWMESRKRALLQVEFERKRAEKTERQLQRLRERTAIAVQLREDLTGHPLLHWFVRLILRRRMDVEFSGDTR